MFKIDRFTLVLIFILIPLFVVTSSDLSDRYQAVNIDGTLSEREAVQYGVPQDYYT